MPLDDQTMADLGRSALGIVQSPNAAEKVPTRIRALRLNIDRLEGRSGRPEQTREENQFELDKLLKLALALDIPTEFPADVQPPAEGEPE